MEQIESSLRRYVYSRIPVGGFLGAVLANDLMDALGRADQGNATRLRDIAEAVVVIVPPNARGSRRAVADWLSGETAT